MTTIRRLLTLAALVSLGLLTACSDNNVPVGSTHLQGRQLLLPEGSDFHGTDGSDCSQCHDVGAFCYQCHFGPSGALTPEGTSWTHGNFPHNLSELKAVGAVCDRCHNITMHYEDEPPTCHRCHMEAPQAHPMGREWLSSQGSQFHGRLDVLSLDRCVRCHNLDTFCSTCHFGPSGAKVPPNADWLHGWSGHTQALLVEDAAVCVKCHEITKLYGNSPGNATCVGCHDGLYDVHTLPYLDLHGTAAKANLKACQLCHGKPGTSFEGGVSVVTCSGCHPAAKSHPTDWYAGHRDAGSLESACSLCHDVTPGRVPPLENAPSCYSAEFAATGGQAQPCHPGGWKPHDMPFAAPSQHGPPAKEDLAFCQVCHGTPGTIRFDGGTAGVACATCHAAAGAHPTDWQGSGSYSHRNSGNTGSACAICHDVTLGRAAPDADAPSCFSATFTNANGQTRICHPGGPGVPHAPAAQFRSPSAHGPEAKRDLVYCQQCHGVRGTTRFDGGSARACAECHSSARAHPTDWQGVGAYSHRNAGNRTVACGLCHNTTSAGSGPLAGAPSCFAATFTNENGQARPCHQGGPGVPHAPPAQFLAPSAHGPEAKKDLLYCQKCHGQPGTIFFQGGPNTACASCHAAAKAHPTNWQGSGTYSHRNALKMETACALCHDYTQGRTAPMAGAPSCYASSFTNAAGQNRSCHPGGPGSSHPLGQPWLDKKSSQFHKYSTLVCANCHTVATFCSQCHFGPSGSRVPPGTSWTHGFSRHTNYENYQTICNACHNVNRSYGNRPSSCHNCH